MSISFLHLAPYLFLVSTFLQASPIKIGFSNDYEPVSFARHGKAVGISPDIVREAIGNELTVEFVSLPWVRAQRMVEEGKLDAMFSIATQAREVYSIPSALPGFTGEFRGYTYIHHPQMERLSRVKRIEEIKDLVACEYLGSGWGNQHLKSVLQRIEFSPTLATKLEMTRWKRCDFIVELDFLVDYQNNRSSLDKLVKLPAVYQTVSFRLLLSKKSAYKELLTVFDKNIVNLEKAGRVRSIIQSWVHARQGL
ncbi:MAG TPA: transporter substrate-binding domain-containing protein [Oligoflexus sp.]|uniref:substrate-binding periplasmic protein n=1 Tax=Oligoflexus sp. TaxID=1971216 RepID=UPI002D61F703|nr:transporter substrate-binding domain-containing protein [Oligoflexus sp.]HYX32285.1 transporter substrate-binding domain-containing protein [Oligoflexus sp.]